MTPEERWEHIERSFTEVARSFTEVATEIAEAEKSFNRRLDRITERHEALAQTVEIVAGMQRASKERLARLDELSAQNEVRLAQLMETMNRLGNIVIGHDQRLDNLENR